MNRLVKKFMVVLLSAFMFLGVMTTPVQAEDDYYPASFYDWLRRWYESQPEEPVEPALEETQATDEEALEETEELAEEAKEEVPAETPTEVIPEAEEVSEQVTPESNDISEDVRGEGSVDDGTIIVEATTETEGTQYEDASVDGEVVEEAVEQSYTAETADFGGTVGLMAKAPSLGSAGSIPVHTKNIRNNGDGTYTISLDVVGDSEKKPNNLNVTVIFDRSGSMTTQRMSAAKAAVNSLANSLFAYNTASAPNTVQMALVSFSTDATITRQPTTSSSQFSSSVNNLKADGGTNWEAALGKAGDVNYGDDDQTFVIFVSDGNPTYRNTADNAEYLSRYDNPNWSYNDWLDYRDDKRDDRTQYGLGSDNPNNTNYSPTSMERCYRNAIDEAQEIVSVVGADHFFTIGAYGDVSRMQQLTTAAGAPAANYYSAQDTAALNKAISDILAKIEMVGIGNTSIDDGTTNQVTTTSGEIAELLEVDTASFKYYRSGGNYGTGTEWSDAPTATFVNGNVDWDLSSVGVLENGVKYTVTFDVYPSQYTYDTIAKLKNGDITYDSLDTEIKKYIENNGDGSYSLRTNTNATLSYDDTRDDAGQQTAEYINPDPVGTDAEKLTINKKWEGGNADVKQLDITVLAGGETFHTATLSESNNWSTSTYISLGIIKKGEALSGALGHDFSFAELGDEQYRWELDAPVVRPMLVDSEVTMLVKEDEKHPAPSGATTYTIEGSTYYVDSAAGGLTATNNRRSHLNVTKKVEGSAPADAKFKFKFTVGKTGESDIWFSVQDASGATIGEIETDATAEVKDGAETGYYYVAAGTEFYVYLQKDWNFRIINLPTGTVYSVEETEMPSGFELKNLTATADGAGTAATVTGAKAEGTVDKPNTSFNVTYTNNYYGFFYVYHSSNNTIERISLQKTANGYVDSRIEGSGVFNIVDEVNKGYLYGGYFKSYTGAKMTDAQIVATKYTEDGTSSAGEYTDAKTTGFWANDIAGKVPYTGSVATAWKAKQAYTEAGNAMTPEAGKVYYLKEVPEAYFTPGLYYVYDDRADGKPLKKLYLMVPTDDGNYNGVASVNNVPAALTRKLYVSYKMTNEAKGTTEVKKAKDVNGACPRGYLTVWDVRDLIGKGGTYEWTPNFITKDGITVTGAIQRTIVIGNGCYDATESKKYDSAQDNVKAFYVYDTSVKSTYSSN